AGSATATAGAAGSSQGRSMGGATVSEADCGAGCSATTAGCDMTGAAAGVTGAAAVTTGSTTGTGGGAAAATGEEGLAATGAASESVVAGLIPRVFRGVRGALSSPAGRNASIRSWTIANPLRGSCAND